MLQGPVIILTAFAYLGLLFAIAYYADKRADAGRPVIASAYVYSLSLAVYATAWTFYGSVGRAASDGVGFLPHRGHARPAGRLPAEHRADPLDRLEHGLEIDRADHVDGQPERGEPLHVLRVVALRGGQDQVGAKRQDRLEARRRDPADAGLLRRLGRVVAIVGDSDETLALAQGEDGPGIARDDELR